MPHSPTYRIRGIPLEFDKTKLKSFVGQLLDLNEIDVKSFARTPYLQNQNVATVQFSETPSSLAGSQKEWRFVQAEAMLIFDTHFEGFTPLQSDNDEDCETDLIVVHGLGGHAFGSFKEKGGPHMWLRDSLPQDLRNVTILIYGYDSALPESQSFQNILDLGKRLKDSIYNIREKKSRPVILLGHSLGGIIIKQAMIEMSADIEGQHVIKIIRGVLLFGSPTGMFIKTLIPMVENQPNRYLLESLGMNSDLLRNQRKEFERVFNEMLSRVYSFYETMASPTASKVSGEWKTVGDPVMLVDPNSAIHGHHSHPINRNHSDMVKYSPHDEIYMTVLRILLELSNLAYMGPRQSDQDAFELSFDQKASLRSLVFEEEEMRKDDIITATTTCSWILRHPKYLAWIRRQQRLLWIKGKPGAGKSTLMKFAVLESEKNANERGVIIASFFFHGRGTSEQKTSLGLFRSLLRQLLRHFPRQLAEFTKRLQKKQDLYGDDWKFPEKSLRDILRELILSSSGQQLEIYIDALDESGEKVAVDLFTYFNNLVDDITPQSVDLIVCLSCRHYPTISFQSEFNIIIEDENTTDIETYVATQLKSDIFTSGIGKHLPSLIMTRADGVFQWVVLVIDNIFDMIRKGNSISDIINQVHETPSELRALYQSLWSSLDDDELRQSLKLFQWINFAAMPLTINELRDIMAFDVDMIYQSFQAYKNGRYQHDEMTLERSIKSLSRGLVEVKDVRSRKIAQFIHQSVPDWLREGDICPLGLRIGHANFQISFLCIKFFSLADRSGWVSDAIHTILPNHPFLKYSITNWPSHAANAENAGINLECFLNLWEWPFTRMINRWQESFYEIDPFHDDIPVEGMSMLHLAAMYGLKSIVTAITLNERPGLNTLDAEGCTALSRAAEANKSNVVKLLLDIEDVDAEIGDGNGRTAFAYAASHAEKAVISEFIRHNVEIDDDVLEAAASNERYGDEIITVILEANRRIVMISRAIIEAAADNASCGAKIIRKLLRQDELTFSQDALEKIISSFDIDTLEVLLNERIEDVKLTAGFVRATAEGIAGPRNILRLLEARSVPLTAEGLKQILLSFGEDVVGEFLSKWDRHVPIDEDIIDSAKEFPHRGFAVLKLLFECYTREATLHEYPFESSELESVCQLLEDRSWEWFDPKQVSSRPDLSNASRLDLIKMVSEHIKRCLNQQSLLRIISSCTIERVRFLLETETIPGNIDENIIGAAVDNVFAGHQILFLLLSIRANGKPKLDKDVMSFIFDTGKGLKFMQKLIQLGPLAMSKRALKIGLSFCDIKTVQTSLLNIDFELEFDEDCARALCQNPHNENFIILESLLKLDTVTFTSSALTYTIAQSHSNADRVIKASLARQAPNELVIAGPSKELMKAIFQNLSSKIRLYQAIDMVYSLNYPAELQSEIINSLRNLEFNLLDCVITLCGCENLELKSFPQCDLADCDDISNWLTANFFPRQSLLLCKDYVVVMLEFTDKRVVSDILSQTASATEEHFVQLVVRHQIKSLKLLLDTMGNRIRITENILCTAIESSLDATTMLLHERSDEISITESALMAYLGSSQSVSTLELLLDRRHNDVFITERFLIETFKQEFPHARIWDILLRHRSDQVIITMKVLHASLILTNPESFWKSRFSDRSWYTVGISREIFLNYYLTQNISMSSSNYSRLKQDGNLMHVREAASIVKPMVLFTLNTKLRRSRAFFRPASALFSWDGTFEKDLESTR